MVFSPSFVGGYFNLYLLSPSSLVQFNPDKHHLDISLLVKQ